MEHTHQRRSTIGTFIRGFGYTALTGALMAGIFLAVNSGAGATVTTFLTGVFGATAAPVIGTVLLVGLSTGIFGGLIQAYNSRQHNKEHEVAYSPVRGRDMAITAASHDLYSPKLQAALERAATQTPVALGDNAPNQPESTRFRDAVAAERTPMHQRLNELLTRETATPQSHTSRVESERAQATETQNRSIH